MWKNKLCLSCNKEFILNSGVQKYCKDCSKKIRRINKSLDNIHRALKKRCYNKDAKDYRWYGQKGIELYAGWFSFYKFKEWSLNNGFKVGLTLDRLDSNCDYKPDNCKWVTIQENLSHRSNKRTFWDTKTARCKKCQQIKPFSEFHKAGKEINVYCKNCRNRMRRKSEESPRIYINYRGERKSINEWSKIIGIKCSSLRWRLKYWNDINKSFDIYAGYHRQE